MTDRMFVDTNVLVYRADRDEPRKREVAKAVLHRAPTGSLVISTQVLQEFYVVATRKLRRPLSEDAAADAVASLSLWPVVSIDKELVAAAITTSQSAKISLWDALIVRAARHANCSVVLTEDLTDASFIDGVRVENPFRPTK